MSDRNATLQALERSGIIAVIRADSADTLVDVCRALRDGGVTTCEITMTTPGALGAVEQAVAQLGGECLIGVGTVLDAETARAAILAGARFLFAPTLDVRMIEMAHRYDRVAIPGALTPTEILTAWSAGADVVKVFPANHFGPQYLRDLRGPLPQIRLTPTGGVNLETAAAWIEAGAVALGVGSALVKPDLIRNRDWKGLTSLAQQYTKIVQQARGSG